MEGPGSCRLRSWMRRLLVSRCLWTSCEDAKARTSLIPDVAGRLGEDFYSVCDSFGVFLFVYIYGRDFMELPGCVSACWCRATLCRKCEGKGVLKEEKGRRKRTLRRMARYRTLHSTSPLDECRRHQRRWHVMRAALIGTAACRRVFDNGEGAAITARKNDRHTAM
jgi:hypothetical protein